MEFFLPVLGQFCKYFMVCHIWAKLKQKEITSSYILHAIYKVILLFIQNISPILIG